MRADPFPTAALPGLSSRAARSAFNWRLETLHFASGLSSALWMTPWLLILLPGGSALGGAQVAAFTIVHLLAAMLISRWLDWRNAEPAAQQIVFVICLIGALAITLFVALPISGIGNLAPVVANGHLFFPPTLLSIVIVIGLWTHGQHIGTAILTPARAAVALRVGILGLIGAALIPDARVQQITLSLLLPFFSTSLLATSLARAASLFVTRETQRSPFGLGWVILVAAIGSGFSLLGLSIALLIGGLQPDGILALIVIPIKALLTLITEILLPLAEAIVHLILPLFQELQQKRNVPALTNNGNTVFDLLNQLRTFQRTDTRASDFVLLILFAIIIIVVVLGLVASIRRARRHQADSREIHESMEGKSPLIGLMASLSNQLEGLLTRLGDLNPFGTSVMTIRRSYARLCVLGEQQGYPRGDSQTPNEYRVSLYKAFPDYRSAIDELTRAYVMVRYGERPDDPIMLQRALEALDRIAIEIKKPVSAIQP